MKQQKPAGYTLYEDSWRVIIATGFGRKTRNPKIGDMLQIWILVKDMSPTQAVMTGKDKLICNECPFRPFLRRTEKLTSQPCYVTVVQAPQAVWKAYKKGNYPKLPSTDLFIGRKVRFGAYGDPTKIPLPLLAEIAGKSNGWTGYSHDWKNPLKQGYAKYLMASVEDVEGKFQAEKLGWRTFRVSSSPWKLKDEVICPASEAGGFKSNCATCRLCCGNGKQAKSVVIVEH